MNQELRIVDVESLGQMTLEVTWSDGSSLNVNLAEPIQSFKVLAPLADPALFNDVEVGDWGFDVVWPGGIELPACTLYGLAIEQAEQAMPKWAFNEWMHQYGLSLTRAANASNLTRRTLATRSSGPSQIPHRAGLACEGWSGVCESLGQYDVQPNATQTKQPQGAVREN